jgi:diguanylate cyclase (GGDEF)-like protein/PAS domain S-box-containing protein
MMIAKSNTTIMQLRYIDKNGIEKIRVDREEENSQPFFVENKNLNNRSDKHCFLESKNKPLNKVWFSSIDLKIKNGKVNVPYKSIFRAIMPIGTDGKFNGIVVIEYSMDNFLKEFLNAPLYDMILANNKGDTLIHYNSSKNWGFYQTPKYKINSDFPKLTQDILSKELVSNKTFVSRKLNLPVEGGLILIMQLNQEYLQATAHKTYSLYLISIIIVLSITIVLSHFLSSSIGKMYDKLNNKLKLYNKKLQESYQELSKKSEQYENEKHKYKTIMELASDGVHVIDENGNVLEFSHSFANMLGYSDDEMRKLNVTEWDVEKEKDDLLNTVKMQTLSPDKFYTKYKRKDGSIIEIQMTTNGMEIDGKRYVYGSARDITELKQTQDKLKYQAEHDPLTGLPNRILFLDRMNQSIKNVLRYGGEVAVLFIDLDHLKDVNDSLGHAIGDLLLKNVAYIFRTTIRQSDTVARLGGDEFAIIINNFNHMNDVISVVQNLLESFKKPILINEKLIYVSLSIGISIYPDDGLDSEILVKNADVAMYKVKNSGRNNYQFYTEDMTEKAFEHILLGSQLRQSIEKNQLEVYYRATCKSKPEIFQKSA